MSAQSGIETKAERRNGVVMTAAVSGLTASPDDAAAAPELWRRASHVSLVGLFVLAIVSALYLTQAVVLPVILAWVVATIFLPVVTWMQRRGANRGVAVALVATLLVVVVLALLTVLSTPLAYWLGRASELGALVKKRMQTMHEPLAMLKQLGDAVGEVTGGAQPSIRLDQGTTSMIGGIYSVVTPAISQAVLFAGAVIFYLLYHARIRTCLVLFLPGRAERLALLKILTDVDQNMSVYFGTLTLANIALGTATVALAYLVGLPNPLLLGVLAASVNFIPFIGVAIVVGTLFVVGLLTFANLGQALIAPAAYIGMSVLEGQFLTPAIIGHRLTLSPFAVFLAIAFWTWMWGPLGAFVAVPLLMAMTIIFRHLYGDDSPDLPA